MPQRLRIRSGWALVVAGAAVACSPTLDWREVRTEGSNFVGLFPCKPAHHARRIVLAQQEVQLNLRVCDAGGATWALAHAELGDPGRIDASLQALKRAAFDNLGASEGRALNFSVAGQTPQPAAGQWQIQGRRPDGQAVQARVAVLAKGTQVAQATVLGARLDEGALETFFSGLRAAP
jgi:hypothetical protein